MFSDAYSGRRVFVSGHTGFKGSWLTLWLLELGAEVIGFALEPPTQPNLFEVMGLDRLETVWPDVAGRLADIRGDVRDGDAFGAALADAAPDVVFHLAAQPLVRRSYTDPRETIDTNVMGAANLLEAVRLAAAGGGGPRSVVVVTSDKCYENRESEHAYVESDALGGWDPYSASKACVELLCDAYRRSFFGDADSPRLVTARAGNVIGGGDWGEDRIVPDCVRSLAAGRAPAVRNPGAVRPWQHVLEPLSGYLWLGAAQLAGGQAELDPAASACAWNLGPGPGGSRTVEEIVELFFSAWGAGEWRQRGAGATGAPHEAGLLSLDVSKAARELGWRPVWSVETAVDAAAVWYRRWHEAAESADLLSGARADVAAYCAAARSLALPWAG